MSILSSLRRGGRCRPYPAEVEQSQFPEIVVAESEACQRTGRTAPGTHLYLIEFPLIPELPQSPVAGMEQIQHDVRVEARLKEKCYPGEPYGSLEGDRSPLWYSQGCPISSRDHGTCLGPNTIGALIGPCLSAVFHYFTIKSLTVMLVCYGLAGTASSLLSFFFFGGLGGLGGIFSLNRLVLTSWI